MFPIREQNIGPGESHDGQHTGRDGVVVARHGVLTAFADDQQQDEIKARHLHEGAATGQPKDHQTRDKWSTPARPFLYGTSLAEVLLNAATMET